MSYHKWPTLLTGESTMRRSFLRFRGNTIATECIRPGREARAAGQAAGGAGGAGGQAGQAGQAAGGLCRETYRLLPGNMALARHLQRRVHVSIVTTPPPPHTPYKTK